MTSDRVLLKDHCVVIGEVAQAHDGSLGLAHAFVDAIADAGADAVKFQTHIASAESTPQEPWRVRFSPQDESRYEYWRRMEFTPDQWSSLKEHASDRGLLFISSPFSLEAVELLESVGIAAWKVASGEVNDLPVIDRIIQSGLPILMSTGMSPLDEIDNTVNRLRDADARFAVLQCTSKYPTPPKDVGLKLIPMFAERYDCPVGLSDHSGTIFPSLAAVTLGASILEVHVTLSREMFGPDVPASVTTAELRQLVEGVRFIEESLRGADGKDELAEEVAPMRKLFMKSVVAGSDLSAGSVLRADQLALRKPGGGIPAERVSELIGRSLARDVTQGEILREEDLMPVGE